MTDLILIDRPTYDRWRITVAHLTGALAGTCRALDRHGQSVPELRQSEVEGEDLLSEMQMMVGDQ